MAKEYKVKLSDGSRFYTGEEDNPNLDYTLRNMVLLGHFIEINLGDAKVFANENHIVSVTETESE